MKEDCGGTDRDFFVEKCHQSAGSNSKLIGVLSISEHAFRKLKKQQGSIKVKAMFAQEIFFSGGESLHTHMVSHMSGDTWQPYYQNKYVVAVTLLLPPFILWRNGMLCMKSSRTMGESTSKKEPEKILCLLNFLILTVLPA